MFATHLGAARDAAKVGKMLKQVCGLAGVGGGGRSRGGVGIGSSHIGGGHRGVGGGGKRSAGRVHAYGTQKAALMYH